MSKTQLQVKLVNEQATHEFGSSLSDLLMHALNSSSTDSLLIFLNGELGAGKTTLVRACLRSLGVEGPIKSPTYTLLEPYWVKVGSARGINIAHLDLYRLLEPEELDYIGARELTESFDIIFVEWPDKAEGALGQEDINIQLNHMDKGRELLLSTRNPILLKEFIL